MPKQPKRGENPDAVSITGRRKRGKERLVRLPVKEDERVFLETYEQDAERQGPFDRSRDTR